MMVLSDLPLVHQGNDNTQKPLGLWGSESEDGLYSPDDVLVAAG